MQIPLPLIIEQERQRRERAQQHKDQRPSLRLPIPGQGGPQRRSDERAGRKPSAPSAPSRGVTVINIWGDEDDVLEQDDALEDGVIRISF